MRCISSSSSLHQSYVCTSVIPFPYNLRCRRNGSEIKWGGWVSPFGNRWIKACSQLPNAYRSVPRPSSPLYAKAFTKRPYLTLESPHHQRQSLRPEDRPYVAYDAEDRKSTRLNSSH